MSKGEMDSNDTFWFRFWLIAGISITIIITSITVSTMISNMNTVDVKRNLIEGGATPAQMVCTFNPPSDNLAKASICGVNIKNNLESVQGE